MAAEFVPLAEWLRGSPATGVPSAGEHAVASTLPAPGDAPERVPEPERLREPDLAVETADALRDARVFRARLADAFGEASARLLRDLACDVLARELRLAPCALDAIVQRALDRAPVVRVRVAPGEAGCVTGVPVVADGGLSAGDAVVELAGGALDARLGVRLAGVLEAFA